MEKEVQESIKKAEEVLGEVRLGWNYESTALAGIGYAILALAKAVAEKKDSEKN